jgi:hypothetical protein
MSPPRGSKPYKNKDFFYPKRGGVSKQQPERATMPKASVVKGSKGAPTKTARPAIKHVKRRDNIRDADTTHRPTSKKLPFIGEESLDAIRTNMQTSRDGPANMIFREHTKCSQSDIQTFIERVLEYGWMSINIQGDGTMLLFCSPTGNTVVLHSASKKYTMPSSMRRIMRYQDIHKVCVNSMAIHTVLTASGIRVMSMVEAECLTEKYQVNLISKSLDRELFRVREGDRPYEQPHLFKGTPQLFALQRVRNTAYLIWRLCRKIQRLSKEGANIVQWSRGLFAEFSTYEGCEKTFDGHEVKNTAQLLKEDPYYCPKAEWTTRFDEPVEAEDYLNYVREACKAQKFQEPSLESLSQLCIRCGREDGHTAVACTSELDELLVYCDYPLCRSGDHTIVVCPVLAGKCMMCQCRGHTPEHHRQRGEDYLNQQMLEAVFLMYSPMHVVCGAIWEARVAYQGHWRCFLYDEAPQPGHKILEATGLKVGVSKRGLQKKLQNELCVDAESIDQMDEAQRALRVDILLAGYTKALLEADRLRAQLLAYGVDPAYPSPRTTFVPEAQAHERELHMGRSTAPTGQGEGSPRHAGHMPRMETDGLMERLTLNIEPEGDGQPNGDDNGSGLSSMDHQPSSGLGSEEAFI